MNASTDLLGLPGKLSELADLIDVKRLLDSAVPALGFEHYALVQHVWDYPVWHKPASADVVRISNYPMALVETMIKRGYLKDDPILLASEKTVAPFEWSMMPKLISLTPRQIEIIEVGNQAGLGNGFVVPLHMPGEHAGSCCFAVKAGTDLPVENFPAAQFIASYAFEAARRFALKNKKARRTMEIEIPAVTRRQRDCMVLVAQGKSDWDIGKLLGISRVTVHKHLEASKRRYGVSTRTQLVVRALFNGQLSFNEIVK